MRYAKNTLVIRDDRDIPLLRQVRNSKFVSHSQLFELMKFGGWERSRDSFNWRVRRLLKASCLTVCEGPFAAGSAVYRITREGIYLLEHQGSSRPYCTPRPHIFPLRRRYFIRSH